MWLAGHATNGEVKPCASTTFNSEWKEWLAKTCKGRAAEKLSGADEECLWAGDKCGAAADKIWPSVGGMAVWRYGGEEAVGSGGETMRKMSKGLAILVGGAAVKRGCRSKVALGRGRREGVSFMRFHRTARRRGEGKGQRRERNLWKAGSGGVADEHADTPVWQGRADERF